MNKNTYNPDRVSLPANTIFEWHNKEYRTVPSENNGCYDCAFNQETREHTLGNTMDCEEVYDGPQLAGELATCPTGAHPH